MAKHRAPEPGHEPLPEHMGAQFWDNRYGEQHAMWSGHPNPQLETEAAALTPGRALDVGAGEGADAIWLADRGWTVTAVDISQVALDRARGHAGDRAIEWQQADLLEWTPPVGRFALVSAQYFHLREPDQTRALLTLAAAVAVGGTLLIVGHAPEHVKDADHPLHGLLKSPTEIQAALESAAGQWDTIHAETRTRPAVDHPWGESELTDTVVVLKRMS